MMHPLVHRGTPFIYCSLAKQRDSLQFPLQYGQTGADTWTTPTQELQAKHALATVAAAIAWGTPWAMWWGMYDNTRTFTLNGTDKEQLGIYEDRGFGLVSKDNRDSALYKAIKQYMTQATEWLCRQIQVMNGALPCRDDFRGWAVQALVDISNSIDAGSGRTNYTAPAVFNRGCT